MSFQYICDFCGRDIDADDELMSLTIKSSDRLSRCNGWIGHYHGVDCWPGMLNRIRLVHEFALGLGQVETISGQAVAARRRKHTKTENE